MSNEAKALEFILGGRDHHVVPTIAQRIARVLNRAATIREESYDHKGSNEATAQYQERLSQPYVMMPDYRRFYQLTMLQAAEKAIQEDVELGGLESMVALILQQGWNDAMDWAKDLDPESAPKSDC